MDDNFNVFLIKLLVDETRGHCAIAPDLIFIVMLMIGKLAGVGHDVEKQ